MRQYANSPVIQALVSFVQQYYETGTIVDGFYRLVWNIDTAGTYGLDVWGRIVNISRYLEVQGDVEAFGFETGLPDWTPFDNAPFIPDEISTDTFRLSNDAYRVLILAKAMSNIFGRSAKDINEMLAHLFQDRGTSFVLDMGGMRMRYVFAFHLQPFEFAIVTNTSVFARPAGVLSEVVEIPQNEFFGFYEAGNDSLPFDDGIFYTGR